MQEGYRAKKNAGNFESLEKCRMLGGLENAGRLVGSEEFSTRKVER